MFGDGVVRAELNWSRLHEVTVRQTISRSPSLLGDLYTVWYAGTNERPAEWRDQDARPMRVREAAAASWPAGRTQRLAAFEAAFSRERVAVQLMLPVYVVGDDRLIIDGTHRAVAACRTGSALRVMLIELHGPLDQDMLPDLKYYC